MTSPLRLRGTTWDHVRGSAPLFALSRQPKLNIEVDWHVRSLHAFGAMPIRELADDYDLLVIDHPSVGDGAREQIILPMDDLVSSKQLADLADNSVGPSWESYLVDGRPYALPIDAAGHVSAWRPDLISQDRLPATWANVAQFAQVSADLRGATKKYAVALPLVALDVSCLVMTLLAGAGAKPFLTDDAVADRHILIEVLEFLHHISKLVHPESFDWNPIRLLERMSESDEIGYVPALFGYSNFSQASFAPNIIGFDDIPSWKGLPSRGLIGGAGIAVSAASKHPERAATFAAYLCSPVVQSGQYFTRGGQPAHRAAWVSEACNEASMNFFSRTLDGLDRGYLRPRSPGFTPFQELLGEVALEKAIIGGDAHRAAAIIDGEWAKLRNSLK